MISKSISSECTFKSIDITGLCNAADVTETLNKYPYWIQMYLPETLLIPPQKPDAETINTVNIAISIIRNEVIKTPISPEENLEGKILTGRKLIVEGNVCQKVVYTADEPQQSVHSAEFSVPFSAYIVVPKEYTFNSVVFDSLDIYYEVNSCIEDLSVELLDPRTILKRVTLLLYAVPKETI